MIKPSPSCWLYLNCEDMTGQPDDQCPNRDRCHDNALRSEHRDCELPYFCWTTDPKFDQLFGHPEHRLTVWYCSEEAIAAGWHVASELFWIYRDGALWIGHDPMDRFSLDIPPAAQALGFARAEALPYTYEARELRVVSHYRGYPQHFLDAGWFPAMDLPYYHSRGLRVGFPFHKPEYQGAIAAGWHPAKFLPEYDPYSFNDDEDEDEW